MSSSDLSNVLPGYNPKNPLKDSAASAIIGEMARLFQMPEYVECKEHIADLCEMVTTAVDSGNDSFSTTVVNCITSILKTPSPSGLIQLCDSTRYLFEIVYKFKLPCKTSKISQVTDNSVNIVNQYSVLQPVVENNVEMLEGSVLDTAPKKSKKPQPIHLLMNPKWRKQIDLAFNTIKTKLPLKILADFIEIRPETQIQYDLIFNIFKTHNIKFFTYSPKSSRPKKFVIKGIPLDIPLDELRQSLTESGFNATKVVRLSYFDNDKKCKIDLKPVLVHLPPGPKVPEFKTLKEAYGFKVKIVNFNKKPNSTLQCFNCQRFNHNSANCYLDPVCLKCAKAHKTVDCDQKHTDTPRCGNCKSNHTANSRACSHHPTNVLKRDATPSKTSNEELKLKRPNTHFRTPGSKPLFSEVVTNKSSNSTTSPVSIPYQENSKMEELASSLSKIADSLERIANVCKALNVNFVDIPKILNLNFSTAQTP